MKCFSFQELLWSRLLSIAMETLTKTKTKGTVCHSSPPFNTSHDYITEVNSTHALEATVPDFPYSWLELPFRLSEALSC